MLDQSDGVEHVLLTVCGNHHRSGRGYERRGGQLVATGLQLLLADDRLDLCGDPQLADCIRGNLIFIRKLSHCRQIEGVLSSAVAVAEGSVIRWPLCISFSVANRHACVHRVVHRYRDTE